jgi:prevent-host-death family protein
VAADRGLEEEPVPTVSITQLGKGSRLVRQVAETGRPAVVTDDGVEVAVILDIDAYRTLRSKNGISELRSALLAAIAEADAGKLIPHEEVLAEVRAEFAGLVPSDVVTEPDAS